ncbi:acetyl-CoA C-acyltransferase [Sneathiella chungangensis]|uniref:Acetyl-CoA C-acyltransferase n=1 Tax=Sneathiella chungangensis TaxID=1418234 RepID=A0A845MJJ3_9PROT|nr:thiolase family protein [Sneathiella chungangensis]MZR23590.1 acetyl-CoA C-acyltransferase [Sneathiella chungangensis]
MKNVVIAGYARSPFTLANKGELIKIRPDEMTGQVVKGLIANTGVNVEDIEDVIIGCAFPEAEQGLNVARIISFLAGIPKSAAATTVNRFCGSSMQAIHMAAGAIQMGAGEVFVCGGIESMTRVPMGGFNPAPHPGLYKSYPEAYVSMGITAENLAKKYNISRQEQEEMAVESHARATAAREAGKFSDEIIPIVDGNTRVEQDGCIRPETTMETLAGLKPAFDANGTVTAATSSPLTDGASATLVCSEEYADANGLKKLARIRSIAVAGCAPELMGIGPVPATKKALERAGVTLADMDIIELNEAFAAQALAVLKESGMDFAKTNLDGGAIALGHPMGATGARITGKTASLLQREGKALGLATQCIGGGQGIATVLEAC